MLDKLHALFRLDGLFGSHVAPRDPNADAISAQREYYATHPAMSAIVENPMPFPNREQYVEMMSAWQVKRNAELEAALKAALDIIGHPDDATTQALWAVLKNYPAKPSSTGSPPQQ